MPAGDAVRRAANAALAAGARTFVYLGTTGVYGNRPNDDWVDEDTSIDLYDPAMGARRADEMALQAVAAAGLHTVVLRLAAIYGPGRGVREKILRGDYRTAGEGDIWFSRIHVLDLVTILRAAIERAPAGAVYCVGDDRPSTQREYADWLSAHLGKPRPEAGPTTVAHRGRRVRNDRLKRELGVTLRYPSFVEGEQQIDSAH
jgi:nucleoside-diphosphate-sugar epimerase